MAFCTRRITAHAGEQGRCTATFTIPSTEDRQRDQKFQLIDRIVATAPAHEAALRALLVREIRPMPDPAADPAATGVIRYGLTIFGDPAAAPT